MMILPNVRASFSRSEAGTIMGLLSGGDAGIRERVSDQIRDQGLDGVLDDPRTLNAVLTADHDVPPALVFYLLVRHALLECGIDDRVLADYLAALLLEFGRDDRAWRITADDPERFQYMVDLMAAADTDDGRRRFMLRAHMGEYALWLTGIFPDHVTARVVRRGAPGLDYFQEMGITGYRMAADSRIAAEHGMDGIYRTAAEAFGDLRIALNLISDRYLFPGRAGSTERLLRQVRDAFGD